MAIGEATTNAFVAFQEGVVPPTLTDESAASLQARIREQSAGGDFGGLGVAGVGRYIADHLPADLTHEELLATSEVISTQVGHVGGSMVRWYEESQERA